MYLVRRIAIEVLRIVASLKHEAASGESQYARGWRDDPVSELTRCWMILSLISIFD